MKMRTSSFEDHEAIPKKHTGFGEDISPELIIEDLPEGTVSLAVILDDLDVPMRKEFTHWVIWNIPVRSVIPEGIPKGAEITDPFPAVQGKACGNAGYRGPQQPPFIHKAHTYRFTVFASDEMADLKKGGKKELMLALRGHILGQAELFGVYDPAM